jgi:DeoR/GlpR family transcriptional regulator of sugar metabolism
MQILRMITTEKSVSITELVEVLYFSESTIKRDLIALEEDGLIRRSRGGASIVDERRIDVPYTLKLQNNSEEKEKELIAKAASYLVTNDSNLFVDSSSTSLQLAKYIGHIKNFQIITNGLATASIFSELTKANVYILGGLVFSRRLTVNGPRAFSEIFEYQGDLAFVSCRGLDLSFGATEVTEGEALMKKGFRKQAEKVVLLVQENKIGKKYLHQSLKITDIDYLVTAAHFTEEESKYLEDSGVQIIKCRG